MRGNSVAISWEPSMQFLHLAQYIKLLPSSNIFEPQIWYSSNRKIYENDKFQNPGVEPGYRHWGGHFDGWGDH